MNRKLAVTLSAVLAIGIGTAYAADYLLVEDDTVDQGDTKTLLTLTTEDRIPAHTKDFAGYAWFYGDVQNTVFAITTHHGVKDSTQKPNQWHAHNVELGAGAGAADACVVDIIDAPLAAITTTQEKLTVKIPSGSLLGTVNEGAVGFFIIAEGDCPETTIGGAPSGLHLGVDVQ